MLNLLYLLRFKLLKKEVVGIAEYLLDGHFTQVALVLEFCTSRHDKVLINFTLLVTSAYANFASGKRCYYEKYLIPVS